MQGLLRAASVLGQQRTASMQAPHSVAQQNSTTTTTPSTYSASTTTPSPYGNAWRNYWAQLHAMHQGFQWGPPAQSPTTQGSRPVQNSTPQSGNSAQQYGGSQAVSAEEATPAKKRRVSFAQAEHESEEEVSDFEKQEEISYRRKVQFGYEVLGLEQPTESAVYDDKLEFDSKAQRGLVAFPIADNVNKGFQEAWNAACGEQDYAWGASLNPPQRGSKIKDSTRTAPPKMPKLAYYKMVTDIKDNTDAMWPTGALGVDANFVSSIGSRFGKPRKTPTDDWMDFMGRIIRIQNQALFFTEVQQKVMNKHVEPAISALEETMSQLSASDDGAVTPGSILPTIESAIQELSEGWESLKEVVSTRNRALQDMTKTATNAMINMLVVRRGETLSNSGLSEEEREVLKHAPPKDNQKRLFSGKLVEFGDLRTAASHNKVLVELARRPQQRPLIHKPTFSQRSFPSLKRRPSHHSEKSTSQQRLDGRQGPKWPRLQQDPQRRDETTANAFPGKRDFQGKRKGPSSRGRRGHQRF